VGLTARSWLAGGAAAGLLVFAGCGGDEGETAPRDISGPPRQVARVVDRLDRAVRAGDFERICRELLTAEARVRAGGEKCAATMAKEAAGVRRPWIKLQSIRVVGDRAEAELLTSAKGEVPAEETLQLVRRGDGYRIVALDR
jgi:hypothetical protein